MAFSAYYGGIPDKRKGDWLMDRCGDDGNRQGPVYMPAQLTENDMITSRWEKLSYEVGNIPADETGLLFNEAPDQSLLKILHFSEQLSLSMRQILSDRQEHPELPGRDTGAISKYRAGQYDSPVEMEVAGSVIRFFCPLTLVRKPEESWAIATMITAAVRKYESRNGSLMGQMKKPVYIIVRRKAHSMKSCYCDNENLEISKAINAIFYFLGFTDSAKNAGYVSLFQMIDKSERSGTEIVIVNKESAKNRMDIFDF